MSINELDFIHVLKSTRIIGVNSDAVGDDCAALQSQGGKFLVTTDLLMDGIHFESRNTPLELIARKSVHVNLSDLAASGATPHSLLVSLALPNSWSTTSAVEFMTHIGTAAAEFETRVIGGDTNVWNGPLAINIVAHGIPHWRGQITRSNARPDHILFVTGPLGGSLPSGRHLTFTPRVRESQWLLDHFDVRAMMDLSDGLATDAKRMAMASGVDIDIDAEKLPIYADVKGTAQDQLHHALCDGEDFELFFCVDAKDSRALINSWPWPTPLTQIGTVVHGPGVLWLTENGRRTQVTKSGFVHGHHGSKT